MDLFCNLNLLDKAVIRPNVGVKTADWRRCMALSWPVGNRKSPVRAAEKPSKEDLAEVRGERCLSFWRKVGGALS